MTPVKKRINTDVMKLMMNDFKVEMINEDDMHAFFIQFHGPKESVYHGYVWDLRVEIPVEYPYEPPYTHFVDPIYHSNIDEETGKICLDVLNQSWTPMADLVAVFESLIPHLLKYPNPDDPLNLEAAHLLTNDPATYEARVREYCEKYAALEEPDNEELDEDEIGEVSEDEMLAGIDNKIVKLDIKEGKDDNASVGENGSGKAADP